MKKILLYLFLLISFSTQAQYYLRGEIKDEKNVGLQNARIFVHTAKTFYYSGVQGSFGIVMNHLYDSITVTLDGYESKTLKIKADVWQSIVLKINSATANKFRNKLISVTKDLKQSQRATWYTSDETYFQLVENEFVPAKNFPNTGFSLNVNKASYSNVRRFINQGSVVPPDAVKVEEMVNYFNLHYREPQGKEVFNPETVLTACPWDNKQQLLFLNVSARKLKLDSIPPGNFVFLIDVSGSMDMPNRLPLLKAAFQLFVKNLRAIDTVSIVIYGGTVSVWLPPTGGAEKDKINKSIEELTAAGDTPGESAIRTAYQVAQRTFIKGGNNRVILATDGDFNVGETSEKALDELITNQRKSGVYLTCLGVGMGNFKDSKLQTLAKKGNGNYAYLDDIQEAEKTLVQELTQTMYSVADNVILNVEFNPAMIKQYRLIGFDNKKDALADVTSDLEGGEIGSGNSTIAIFQIEPTDENLLLENTSPSDNLGTLTIKYSLPNDTSHRKLSCAIVQNYKPLDQINPELKFATAVAMTGMKLRNSQFIKNVDWLLITQTAITSAAPDNYLQQEFLKLLEKIKKLYNIGKKKKKGYE